LRKALTKEIFEYIDFKVIFANIGTYLFVSLTDVEFILKFLALSMTIGYTLWKWIHEYKRKKK